MSALELGAAVGPFGEISGAVAEVLNGMPAALDRHAADIRAIRIERCYTEGLAVAALETAAPLIEAQVREMVAGEIEAACYPHTFQSIADVECPACTKAARIARGVTP